MIRPVDSQLPPPPAPEGPERDTLVLELLENARDFLGEARTLDPSRQGRSLVHTAYYAVFWLARAAITTEDGTYPYRHSSLEARLAEMVKQVGASELTQAYGLIVDTVKERNIFDYDRRYRPTAERAAEILQGAENAFSILPRHFPLPE